MRTSPELLEDDARYRQVSPAAVVALLLGLASPLAFVGPVFFLFPAAAVGTGLLALSKIRRAEGGLTGGLLARIAIALALACVAAALVRNSVRDTLLQRQAADAAQEWLGLLADGRFAEARPSLTSDGASQFVPSQGSPDAPPIQPDQAEALILQGLRSNELTRAVSGKRDPGVFESASAPAFNGPKTTVLVKFGLEDSASAGHRHVEIQMTRARAYEVEGKPWRVDRWVTGEVHAAH